MDVLESSFWNPRAGTSADRHSMCSNEARPCMLGQDGGKREGYANNLLDGRIPLVNQVIAWTTTSAGQQAVRPHTKVFVASIKVVEKASVLH